MGTMKLYELVNHYHIGTELTCAEAMFLACNEYYHLYLSEETRKLFSVMGLGMQTEQSCCGAFTVAVGIIGLMTAKEGQTDVDLGSGGGFDVFQAGEKVKASGRVIGVDMTPEMLAKARKNIGQYRQRTGLDNVEFRLGEIECLPVPDNSVDVVLSNCVINLSPDKPKVWREIYRVLKSGGKVSVSDLALLKPLPDTVRDMAAALVGCVAGAVLVEETKALLEKAGFTSIVLTPKPDYVRNMQDWNDPLYKQIAETLPQGEEMADYVVSLSIEARK